MFPSLFAVAAVLLLPLWAAAQSIGPDEMRARTQPYVPAPSLTLRTQVEMVEVPVVVRDRQHRAVSGLTQDAFTILDLGKKQDITAFSVEHFTPGATAAPAAVVPPGAKPVVQAKASTPARYIALCFDDLATDAASLMRAKAAAKQFVKTALAPGDRVAVVTTAWPKSTEFTNDVPTMLGLIEKVSPNSRTSETTSGQCPPIKPYEAFLIVNSMDSSVMQAKVAEFRACASNPPKPEQTIYAMSQGIWEQAMQNSLNTLRAIDGLVQGMAKIPGRRMILLASSGFLSGNLEYDEDQLIKRALHAGVVINTLGARGLYTVIPGGDAAAERPTTRVPRSAQITEIRVQSSNEMAKDDGLAVLASGTGGVFFHDNNDLLRGFKELGMVPEAMYVLGFAPSDVVADGRFHTLKVRLNQGNGYSVQARMGYSAPPKPKPAQPGAAPKVDIDSALMSSDTRSDLPASITWKPDPQKAEVTYLVHIDLGHLKMETRQDRHVQQLTFVAVLHDANGKLVSGDRSDVDLALTDATFARLVASGGLNVTLTVKAPPGSYIARGLILDGLEGKLVTSAQQVQIQ